jgi:hypothetical protein
MEPSDCASLCQPFRRLLLCCLCVRQSPSSCASLRVPCRPPLARVGASPPPGPSLASLAARRSDRRRLSLQPSPSERAKARQRTNTQPREQMAAPGTLLWVACNVDGSSAIPAARTYATLVSSQQHQRDEARIPRERELRMRRRGTHRRSYLWCVRLQISYGSSLYLFGTCSTLTHCAGE